MFVEGVATKMPHNLAEDIYAMLTGCILLVLGLVFLRGGGLSTGGTAGLALLLSYLLPLPAGLLFTLLNAPFFLFAYRVMGVRFAIKTILVSFGIAGLSIWTRGAIHVDAIHPAFAALVGGTVIGLGILILVRHQAGVGGTGVITLWLLRHRGWNVGRTQLVMDGLILAAAIPVISTAQLGWSVLSAIITSLTLMTWHRPDRYIAH